jgi:SAM-dependent methyltransferase
MPTMLPRLIPQRLRRWSRGLKTYLIAAWSDALGWARGTRDPLVPPRYRLYAGWRCEAGKVSARWSSAILDVGGLAPDGRVLDIGCGPGRIATRLIGHLDKGSYVGFDIDPRSIRWCQRKISSQHPNFRFQLADVHNAQYNPAGSQEARAYTFPYPDNEFDLALAASVFTHMLPGEIERYVSEAARVLKANGRLLASFFVLNDDTQTRVMVSGRRKLGDKQEDGGIHYRSEDPTTPERMIAVFEEGIREIYADAGLTIETIGYGKWCGRREGFHGFGQDLVVARKDHLRPEAAASAARERAAG